MWSPVRAITKMHHSVRRGRRLVTLVGVIAVSAWMCVHIKGT